MASRIGTVGRAAENAFLDRTGARPLPGSGATHGKGDASFPDWLVEVKSTISASLSVKHEWLAKIVSEARFADGRRPALAILFTDDRGRPKRDGAWVAIPETEFLEYLAWKERSE